MLVYVRSLFRFIYLVLIKCTSIYYFWNQNSGFFSFTMKVSMLKNLRINVMSMRREGQYKYLQWYFHKHDRNDENAYFRVFLAQS